MPCLMGLADCPGITFPCNEMMAGIAMVVMQDPALQRFFYSEAVNIVLYALIADMKPASCRLAFPEPRSAQTLP